MRNNVRKINVVFFITFFADALITPYLALFFISLGIKGVKQGVLLAFIPLSNLLGNLLFGKLSFNLKRNLRICSALLLVQAFVMMFYGFITNYVFLVAFTILFALHNSPVFSLEDSLACKYCEEENKTYAITRMVGSISYLLSVMLGGFLVSKIAYKYVFVIAGILFTIGGIFSLFIKPAKGDELLKKEKISFKKVLSNRLFIMYLIFYVMMIGSWQVGEAYLSTHYKSLGIQANVWGYRYSFQVLIEVLTILFVEKFLKKAKRYFLLMIGIILMCVRYLIISLNIPLYLLIFIETPIRGIIWGIILSSHVDFLKKIVSSDLMAKSITLLAICVGVFSSLMNYLTPYIFNQKLNGLYFALSILQFVGLLILLFNQKLDRMEENNVYLIDK